MKAQLEIRAKTIRLADQKIEDPSTMVFLLRYISQVFDEIDGAKDYYSASVLSLVAQFEIESFKLEGDLMNEFRELIVKYVKTKNKD